MKILLTGLLFLMTFNSMAAVKIVECEDSEGNTFFSKTCPPGSTPINEKRISTGSGSGENKAVASSLLTSQAISATMYMIPKCSPCDGVREFFRAKNIPLTEKNVEGNVPLQNELVELNGSLNVPITVIGEKKLAGYNRVELLSALKAAGWTEPTSPDSSENVESE